jgi:TPR repeat protein
MLISLSAMAVQADPGSDYYLNGEYDKAAESWAGPASEGDVVALHNMGVLSRDGLGSTPKDHNKAAVWFLRSAQKGYVPAMVSLAEVQTELGQSKIANSWLTLAARWGNTEAISHLKTREQPVPKADLYTEVVGAQQLERMRETGDGLRAPIRKMSSSRVSVVGSDGD